MTSKKLGIALLSLAVLAIFAVAPAVAAPVYAPDIEAGDAVFIGESGLNISAALNPAYILGEPATIYWYSTGSQPGTDVPTQTLKLTGDQIRSFYVSPELFQNYQGRWYYDQALVAVAFDVKEPSLKVGLYRGDKTTSLDGKKAIADSDVYVRIDSSFATLFERNLNNLNNLTTVNVTNLNGDKIKYPNYTATDKSIAWIVDDLKSSYNATLREVGYEAEELIGLTPSKSVFVQRDLISTAFYVVSKGMYNNTDSGNSNTAVAGIGYETYDGGIDVNAVTPNNAKLESLLVVNDDGTGTIAYQTPIIKQQPNVADYWINSLLPVWSAGRIVDEERILGSKILTGDYKFQADININGMKDNLGSVSGKTVSNTATVTIDKETVFITSDKATVIRNNGFSVKVEGNPKSLYAVWFTGVNGYIYTEVPAFIKDQKDVTGMSWTVADNTTYKGTSTTISSDMPDKVGPNNDLTSNYAVVAQTDAAGVINIGIITNENTKDTTFTIRAEDYWRN